MPKKQVHTAGGDGESGSSWLFSRKASVSRTAKPAPVLCQLNQPLPVVLGSVMFSQQAWEEIALSLQLSKWHSQIVQGMFNDHTDAAIAEDLDISPHTVHTYIERLYRKLGDGRIPRPAPQAENVFAADMRQFYRRSLPTAPRLSPSAAAIPRVSPEQASCAH
jgi:hypothetical protein